MCRDITGCRLPGDRHHPANVTDCRLPGDRHQHANVTDLSVTTRYPKSRPLVNSVFPSPSHTQPEWLWHFGRRSVKLRFSSSESCAVSTWCVHVTRWPQKASWTVWFGATAKEMRYEEGERESVSRRHAVPGAWFAALRNMEKADLVEIRIRNGAMREAEMGERFGARTPSPPRNFPEPSSRLSPPRASPWSSANSSPPPTLTIPVSTRIATLRQRFSTPSWSGWWS
ncbi:hypothetical protein LR48_Vigan10g165300 [Vigna angularis]|uniref:Uncharacterized protein n=1 Tax=Phaseolus angularis TaxID=3914 RepID=A0A0L9VL20_PHAAN|nr:hypothetical protein LR48_Vigan10g165300 [Vigna angularis]